MESASHGRLKQLSAAFLLLAGCRAVAAEVRCPGSRYLVDIAGYLDPLPKRVRVGWTAPEDGEGPRATSLRRGERPKTVVVECKQSRGDFLRDTREMRRLLAERERLDVERQRLEEERIKVQEPQLRRSGSLLFAGMEDWEFTASRLATYRKVLGALRRVDQRLYGQTKLWMIANYRLADCLYVAAPAGMIRARELPRGWGLWECHPRDLAEAERRGIEAGAAPTSMAPERRGIEIGAAPTSMARPLRVAVQCEERGCRPQHQFRLLRNIAAAATRESMRGLLERVGDCGEHRERLAPTCPLWA